jgi:hypothetical protein
MNNTMVYVQSNNMYVTGSLYVGGVQITASDRRLKLNEKPLVNALAVINILEPAEYDQTHMLVDQYTSDTPQYHQCGFIAQSVEQIDELRHVVLGGELGEDGTDNLRGLNYNALFTYAVKAIQELSKIVEAQQSHIDKYKKIIYELIFIYIYINMSLYNIAYRINSVEYSVDELSKKADSNNAVLTGITTINGPAFLNGAVALGSSITGIDISDVSGLQNALDLKAPSASPIFTGTTSGITEI